jgi:polyisoprenoid-binding protein YceI
MKLKALIITLICLSALTSFAPADKVVYMGDKGVINFQSDATLEIIKASSKQLRGVIDPTAKTFAFKVAMTTFEGFNSGLQMEHFNENYMESTKYPEAVFSGKIIEDIDLTKNGTYTIRAKGKLNVHGVEQERIIKSELKVNSSVIKVHSSFTVLLTDHNIIIPKVVHEKLASEIQVEVDIDLTQRNK